MSERVNRHDQIVDVASELFIKHGYTATSIRQIAEEVGCTEAAIYYHFKDGKRELFRAVIERYMPDITVIIEGCREATSLCELAERLWEGFVKNAIPAYARIRWVIAEFPQFSPEERAILHGNHLLVNRELTQIIHRFVHDEKRANHLAWWLVATGFGYIQLFHNIDLQSVADYSPDDMLNLMVDLIENIPD